MGQLSSYETATTSCSSTPTRSTEQRRLTGHTALVQAVEFSHDGTRLASGDADGTIIVWDIATGSQVESLSGHTDSVRALAFDPDDDTLYSAAADQRLLVWDLRGERRFIPRLDHVPRSRPPGVPMPCAP